MPVINWAYFPRSTLPPPVVLDVVQAFEEAVSQIDSSGNYLSSNEVLAAVGPGLAARGFAVEVSKQVAGRLRVPVLFGRNGRVVKAFDADAWDKNRGMVMEVEAGRGVVNNQFLKDFFQACMMQGIEYFGVAVRNEYRGGRNFEAVETFFDTLYASDRLSLPLRGVLILGY